MTPTNELRFVEREVTTPYGNDGAQVSKTFRILQQKWTKEDAMGIPIQGTEEWRDVPIEQEPKQ